MSKPEHHPSEVTPRPSSPNRRRLGAKILQAYGLVKLLSLTGRKAHAQETETPPDAAQSIANLFPSEQRGNGWQSQVVGEDLIIESSNPNGIATIGSKPDAVIPRNSQISVTGETEGGSSLLLGQGDPTKEYVRITISPGGLIKGSSVINESGFKVAPLEEGIPSINVGPIDQSSPITFGFQGEQFVVNIDGNSIGFKVNAGLADRCNGGRIVLGAVGTPNSPAKAKFNGSGFSITP